jgi:hypothetical protein
MIDAERRSAETEDRPSVESPVADAVARVELAEIHHRAQETNQLLKQLIEVRGQNRAAPDAVARAHENEAQHGPITITAWGRTVEINGRHKQLSLSAFDVVIALADAGTRRLHKDEIENISAGARQILKNLAQDCDWQRIIHFPAKKGEGYGIY